MATLVSGLRGTDNLSTYRLQVDIADGISLLNPNENPFTLLSKKVGKVATKQPKHSWLEDILQPETDYINYSTGYASTSTALTVKDYTKFTVGDLWMNWRTYEVMLVSTTPAANVVGFTRNWPGVASGHTGYNAALVDADYLVRLGNVNEEGATAPIARTTVETQVDNYTQIIRTPFKITETELNSLMYGEQDLPYQTRKKGIEHAREIEYNMLFGIPSYANTGATLSKPMRSMGGVWWYLKENAPSANIVSATTLDSATFLSFLRAGFRYGSSKKVLFACPLVLSALESWGFVKLLARPTDTTFGINITNWVSPHGEIAIINHKMLEGPNPGTAGGFAFLLDMQNIQYAYLRNRDTKLRTGIQAPDADLYLAEYLTECSLKIKLPATHGAIYGVTGFSA